MKQNNICNLKGKSGFQETAKEKLDLKEIGGDQGKLVIQQKKFAGLYKNHTPIRLYN